jgi:hypothetical protein
MDDVQEKPKKQSFFSKIAGKVSAKLNAISPNIIGWIILGILGLVAALCFVGIFTSLIRDRSIGDAVGMLVSTVVILGFIAMTYHMMKALSMELKFKTEFSVDSFKEMRIKSGKSENSTEEENQMCLEILQQAVECWTIIENENGRDIHYPNSMKEITAAKKLLVKIIDIAPTDNGIVDDFCNSAAVIKDNTNREFDGSGLLLLLAAIMFVGVNILFILSGGFRAIIGGIILSSILWGVPAAMYFLACRTPRFMINSRKEKKPSRFKLVNAIIAIIFGAGAAGLMASMGTNTTWYKVFSDGRREVDHEMQFYQLMFALGIKAFILFLILFALFIISMSVVLWAFINYLRNYVIYK